MKKTPAAVTAESPRYRAALSFIVAIALGATALARPQDALSEGKPLEAKANELMMSAFKTRIITCGKQIFTYTLWGGGVRLTEIVKPQYRTTTGSLSTADRMNGYDYGAVLGVDWEAARIWDENTNKWAPWTESLQYPDMATVRHQNGEWKTDWDEERHEYNTVLRERWEEAIGKIDCASVQQITDPSISFKAAKGTFSTTAFKPNAVITRDSFAMSHGWSCPLKTGNEIEVGTASEVPGYQRTFQGNAEAFVSLPPGQCPELEKREGNSAGAFGAFAYLLPVYFRSTTNTGAPQAASRGLNQTPQAGPSAPEDQPFVANAVLSRDWKWGLCLFPKGTKIMDLGHSRMMPESVPIDDVRTDPAICPPRRGTGVPIGVSKSAIAALP